MLYQTGKPNRGVSGSSVLLGDLIIVFCNANVISEKIINLIRNV